VHAYLARLEGDAWMLVDGGADTDEAWEVLDAAVRGTTGGWGAVALHVVTHMHLDHLGLAARVHDACGAPLAMGRLDAERAAGAAADPRGEAAYRANVLREGGAPQRLWGWAEPGPTSPAPPPVAHALEGEAGPLPGAHGWRWLPTPGHTAGHLGLLRSADGTLIGGDAVLPRITPTLGVNRQRADPVGDYLGTLERLRVAAPRLILPGHGDPIPEPAARLAELRHEAEGEGSAVAALLADAGSTAWEAAETRYAGRDLPVAAELQALRETLAHLHRLHRLGELRRETLADGAARFRRGG
jgi:glyoxylase-like metal-dependent hydrolase (beta-lactamase superfamily II)